MLIPAKDLRRFTLRCPDGDIGTVKEFLFDDQRWFIRYLVIDTGSWLRERKVLLSPQSITEVDSESEVISVELTMDQIEACPPLASDQPVSRQMEDAHHAHYGWSWGADSSALGMSPYFGVPVGIVGHQVETGPATNYMDHRHSRPVEDTIINQTIAHHQEQADPHLRSTTEVADYDVSAADGEVGSVSDLIIDTQEWFIRYLVIETGHWWAGKKVLVAPHCIEDIRWSDAKVFLTIDRLIVKSSPEFAGAAPSPADEASLHRHYHRQEVDMTQGSPPAQ